MRASRQSSGARMLRWFLLCSVVFAALVSAPRAAWAQGAFQIDSVLVMPAERVDDPGLRPAASALQASLERMLAAEYFVIPFAKVPNYQDYTAAVYLDACPDGNYLGCAYVLGARAKVDWAVGMQLERTRMGDEVLLTIIDVKESRPVISFSSRVTPDNHGAVAAGLSLVLDSVIRGAASDGDVRGDFADPRAEWERRREEARRAAEELGFADQGLQILVRPDDGDYEDPRLRPDDLKDWELRDDEAPWVSLNMSKGEYVRYKNSGLSLSEWRAVASGRLHKVMLRAEGAFGAGSYKHVYDGRWMLDDQTLEPIDVRSHRQIEKGGSTAFRLEVAYGVHQMVEVGVGIAARTARFSYFYQREIENAEVPQLIAEGETFRYTPEIRAFAGFIPFPAFFLRPTAHAALAYWSGSPISRVVKVEGPPADSPAPSFVFFHLMPGVEFSPNRWVSVFARFNGELMLIGGRRWSAESGEALLADPYTPADLGLGGGWGVSVGVTAHLGPLVKPK